MTSESLGDAGVVDDLPVGDSERGPLLKLPQVRVLRRVITNEVGEPPDPVV